MAAKVFVVRQEITTNELASKLKGFRTSETFREEGAELELIKETKDLNMREQHLRGLFCYDDVIRLYHHGKAALLPKTFEVPFYVHEFGERLFLTVMEKKNRANNVANQLSKIVFITSGHIVEARIPPEVLKKFHEENFEDTKVVFFDDVDIPNVEKLSLYGSGLANTSLYSDYSTHGKLWYAVIKFKKQGIVAGITRNCIVTVFSFMDREEFMDYVAEEIFPLIQ